MVDLSRTAEPTKRNPINWPERMIQVEGEVSLLAKFIPEVQQQTQCALASLAESNERWANHFEEAKRIHQRMDEQDVQAEMLRAEIIKLEKALIEVRMQNKQLLEFIGGVKKAGWITVTGGAVVAWWAIQKWLEHPR